METDDGGAFTIQCSDRQEVHVPKRLANLLRNRCDYFRAVFDHNTIETKTRTIQKKDWSSNTVRHLLYLMEHGRIGLEHMEDLVELAEATDQVTIPIRIHSPFGSDDSDPFLSEEKREKFLAGAKAPPSFQLSDDEMSLERWSHLLDSGVLLAPKWDVLVATASPVTGDNEGDTIVCNTLEDFQSFTVHHAFDAPTAVLLLLDSKCKSEATYKESVSVLVESKLVFDRDMKKTIKQKTGGGMFKKSNDDKWFMTGSFHHLNEAFKVIRKHLRKNTVSLWITTRSPLTVGKLINACQKCPDYPGMLGLEDDAFYIEKTVPDLMVIFDYMLRDDSSGDVEGSFELCHCIEQQEGVF